MQGRDSTTRGGTSKVSVDLWQWVGVATTAQAVTAYGGAVLWRDGMTAVGLVEEVDATVGLKRCAAVCLRGSSWRPRKPRCPTSQPTATARRLPPPATRCRPAATGRPPTARQAPGTEHAR